MLVKDICGEVPHTLISQAHFWERHVESLTPIDLDAFVRTHKGTRNYYEAVRQIEHLIDVGWHAIVSKRIQVTPPIIFYDPRPTQRITVDELCSWLSETTEVRRRAILFCLETKMPICDVIDLTWKKFLSIQHSLPQYAVSLAKATPRHIRLDYVFWEPMERMISGPLFGLAETMLEVSQGLGYEVFKRLYDTAIPIDSKADYEDFAAKFCLELDARITDK